MSIDLTDEIMAPAEAVVIDHGALVEHDAIDLAWDTVNAALPLIEAAVREQIARDIEGLVSESGRLIEVAQIEQRPDRIVKYKVVAEAAQYAARIARGEQP